MTQRNQIQLFEEKKVRTVWDDEQEKWYFSIVDVCGILTDQPDYDLAKNYWKVLKFRLIKEGNESVTKCNQLKLVSPKDGKNYKTDVADTEQLFRLIQSIPSKKAEPFKQWMAQVAAQRLDQMQDPELNFEQAYADYPGVHEGQQYASLTDIITRGWSGKTTKQYKQFKGLHKENLRDNMTNIELALNTLAEASATEISKSRNPKGFKASAEVARQGSRIAGDARNKLEAQVGHSVISPSKAADYLPPAKEVKALPEGED